MIGKEGKGKQKRLKKENKGKQKWLGKNERKTETIKKRK